MPATLFLQIPDLDAFTPDTPLAWTRVERAGAAPIAGRGTLAALPRDGRIVAVTPVSRILYLETPLPPVSKAKRNALLNYAIEDKLTIDPDTVHASILASSGDRYVIAAVDRGWLTALLGWLREGGVHPHAVVSAASLLEAQGGSWAVRIDAAHGFARRPDGYVIHFDPPGGDEVPLALKLACNEARERGAVPSELVLEGEGATAARAHRWQAGLGLPVRAVGAMLPGPALEDLLDRENLLTGSFAATDERVALVRALRVPALLLALLLAVQCGMTWIDNARLRAELQAMEGSMRDQFRRVFPDAQTIVDAPLQMQRKLGELQRERGLAGEDPVRQALTRLAGFAAGQSGLPAPPEVLGVTLREGVATLRLRLAEARDVAALRDAAARHGGFGVAPEGGADPRVVNLSMRLKS